MENWIKIKMGFLVFSLIITIVSWRVDCSSVSDQTGAVGLSSIEGFFAGYGDFNSDQATDIFTISHDCKWKIFKIRFLILIKRTALWGILFISKILYPRKTMQYLVNIRNLILK